MAKTTKKHPELQGRGRQDGVTGFKKGSSMPARKKNEPMKTFYVAEGCRIAHPNLDLDHFAPLNKRIAEAGDPIKLTKAQAEWCMANNRIDSILPDFEEQTDDDTQPDSDADTDAGGDTKEGAGTAADGAGSESVGGASAGDDVSAPSKSAPRRKTTAL